MAPVVGRIRRQATFRALSRPDGRGQRGPVTVVFSGEAAEVAGFALAGYAVGRRHGGAVERNRLRRRLREAMRAAADDLDAGAYLVRAAPTAARLDFEELSRDVRVATRAASKRARDDGRGAP